MIRQNDKRVKITEEELLFIKEMLDKNFSLRQIGKLINKSHERVRKIKKRYLDGI